jgi:hypothetical protein
MEGTEFTFYFETLKNGERMKGNYTVTMQKTEGTSFLGVGNSSHHYINPIRKYTTWIVSSEQSYVSKVIIVKQARNKVDDTSLFLKKTDTGSWSKIISMDCRLHVAVLYNGHICKYTTLCYCVHFMMGCMIIP